MSSSLLPVENAIESKNLPDVSAEKKDERLSSECKKLFISETLICFDRHVINPNLDSSLATFNVPILCIFAANIGMQFILYGDHLKLLNVLTRDTWLLLSSSEWHGTSNTSQKSNFGV